MRSMDESITVDGEAVANVLLLVELAAICGLVVGISVTSKYTGIIGTITDNRRQSHRALKHAINKMILFEISLASGSILTTQRNPSSSINIWSSHS